MKFIQRRKQENIIKLMYRNAYNFLTYIDGAMRVVLWLYEERNFIPS